jgi:hypothetical protein
VTITNFPPLLSAKIPWTLKWGVWWRHPM